MAGWIKLYRKSTQSRVFQNEGLLKVWIWCLLRANHEESWVSIRTGRGKTEVAIKPGQFIFGRNAAASELRMKPTTIRLRMLKLKHLQNIDIQTDKHYSIISIINWESYQGSEKRCDSQHDNQLTTNCQPTDTNKNEKNDKNLIKVPNGTSSTETEKQVSVDASAPPSCPHKKIIDIYHQELPSLPHINEWDATAAKWLKARWREKKERQSDEFWREYFRYVGKSDFLMGNKTDFQADLRWLVRPSNFAKVVNGNYHHNKTFHDRLVNRRQAWLKSQQNRGTSDS
jgi:hypothetical protein